MSAATEPILTLLHRGIVTPAATAEASLERYPADYAADGTKRGVIYCHGSTGRAWEPLHPSTGLPTLARLVEDIVQAGYPVLSCDNGLVGGSGTTSSETWGNDTAISRIHDAVTYMTGTMGAKADKVILIGGSMGGCNAMNYARVHPDKVAGMILLRPVSSLQSYGTAVTFTGINAAYGGTYNDATHGPTHSPVQFAASLAGIPTLIQAASDDTVVVYSTVQTVATAIGATLVNIGPGGHSDSADQHIPALSWLTFVQAHA